MKSFCSQAYTMKGLITLNKKASDIGYTYILKGYPFSLKNQLLKKIAGKQDSLCVTACDYNGALISLSCKEKDFQIIDGTYPNTIEPETYGITDSVIDLNAFQNSALLKQKKDSALRLFEDIRKEERRCSAFISAAKGISDECRRSESQYINKSYLNRFAAKLWRAHGYPPTGKVGRETRYFADVLTGLGMKFDHELFNSFCTKASVINDFSTVVSSSIVDKIRLYALSCGFDVITLVDFSDAASPRHVIIPQLEYGIYSAVFSDDADIINAKRIRKNRFFNQEYPDFFKSKAAFCKKACSELTDEAAKSIRTIESLQKQLDKIFLEATDNEAFVSKIEQMVTKFDKW